jgi:pimeloyl-ACP methyl ester carboxylesterase
MTDVSFPSGDITLAGTLTLPDGPGPHPAVVLLHGAGWGPRKFYGAYVEAFVEAGVACLAFDRRGEGESTGSAEQDIFAFADDAVAAWHTVRAQAAIDPARVGFWGYSNGAWVATLAGSRLPACAFLCLTGAAGVSPGESEAYRRSEELRLQGISQRTVDAVHRTWSIVFDYLSNGEWRASWDDELRELETTIGADAALDALPVPEMVKSNPMLDAIPRFDSPNLRDLKEQGAGRVPGMGFDPIPSLRKVACPVHIVLAEHDHNLPTPESARRFGEVATERGDGSLTVEIVPDVDHRFGLVGDFLMIPKRPDFVAGYLEGMAKWMAAVEGMPLI